MRICKIKPPAKVTYRYIPLKADDGFCLANDAIRKLYNLQTPVHFSYSYYVVDCNVIEAYYSKITLNYMSYAD